VCLVLAIRGSLADARDGLGAVVSQFTGSSPNHHHPGPPPRPAVTDPDAREANDMEMTGMQRVKTAAVLACALAAVALAAACGSSSSNSSSGAGTSTSKALNGAGSTLVAPLMSQWEPDYNKSSGVTVTYGAIGSGGGIDAITARTVDFGASDAPLSAEQATACKGCLQVPWALAAVVPAYNLSYAPDHL
jgi:hypothetical protein